MTMMRGNKPSSHIVSPVLSAKNDGAPPSDDDFARRSERPIIREERIQSPRQNSKETKIQSRIPLNGVPLPRTTTIIITTTTTKRRRRRKRTMGLRRDIPRLPRRHRHLHPRKATTTTMKEVEEEVNRREGKKSRETRRKRNKQQQR